jgi:hypothetical protein
MSCPLVAHRISGGILLVHHYREITVFGLPSGGHGMSCKRKYELSIPQHQSTHQHPPLTFTVSETVVFNLGEIIWLTDRTSIMMRRKYFKSISSNSVLGSAFASGAVSQSSPLWSISSSVVVLDGTICPPGGNIRPGVTSMLI